MSFNQLDFINEMLASLGELPVNEVDTDHDLIASGVRKIAIASAREQAKGWWFNKEHVTILPDRGNGEIYVPKDVINVLPARPNQHLVTRGRRLYDTRTESGYVINRPITATITREIPFEDLPMLALMYVGYAAVVDFMKDYDADRLKKYEQALRSKEEARVTLRAEDIRQQRANLLHKPATVKVMWDAGVRDAPGWVTPGRPPVIGGGGGDNGPPLVNFANLFTSNLDPIDLPETPLVDFSEVFNDAVED